MSYIPILFKAPRLTDFTPFNAGITPTQTSYGFNFTETTNSANHNVRGLTQVFDSTSVTTKLILNNTTFITGGSNYLAGPGWTDGTGIVVVDLLPDNSGNTQIEIRKFLDATTYDSSYFSVIINNYGNEIWIRLQNDSGNRNTYISLDGVNFVLIHSVSDTDFITATDWGMFVDAFDADMNVTFQGWNK